VSGGELVVDSFVILRHDLDRESPLKLVTACPARKIPGFVNGGNEV
jgi:hypothetical protein